MMIGTRGAAADAGDTVGHYHDGVFKQYTPGPYKKTSKLFVLSAAAKQRLAESSKPECSVVALPTSATAPKGTMRCTSVLDVRAPPNIVWSLLLDFPRYPQFVSGISSCKPYSKKRTLKGGKIVGAKYTVKLSPLFKIQYHLEHHYEPTANSMAWHLDYTKKSDVFDSVGYWHVEAQPWGSRVYYTQDSLLPSWIPAPVRKTFTKVAMRSATDTLEPKCLEEMERQQKAAKFGRLPKLSLLKVGMPRVPELPKFKLPGRE